MTVSYYSLGVASLLSSLLYTKLSQNFLLLLNLNSSLAISQKPLPLCWILKNTGCLWFVHSNLKRKEEKFTQFFFLSICSRLLERISAKIKAWSNCFNTNRITWTHPMSIFPFVSTLSKFTQHILRNIELNEDTNTKMVQKSYDTVSRWYGNITEEIFNGKPHFLCSMTF